MQVERCPTSFLIEHAELSRKPVPRIVHQIDLDKKNISSLIEWETYCDQNGFAYKLWTRDNLSPILEKMTPSNRALFTTFLERDDEENTTNLLRYEVLRQLGGIYCHQTLSVPYCDLLKAISPEGLTLTTATGNHHTGAYLGFFPSLDFIATPPNHPLLQCACTQIETNASHFQQTTGLFTPFYLTGPAFFHRILNGSFQILPSTYLQHLEFYQSLPPVIQESLSFQPDYDINCDFLRTKRFIPNNFIFTKKTQKVPRIIHQIWFGNPSLLSKEYLSKWKKYCEKHNYTYYFWHEGNIQEILLQMPFMQRRLFEAVLYLKNWWAASDILRLYLIKEFGGIYLDCDFHPPQIQEEMIDFFSFVHDKEVTLMIEPYARSIGSHNALFVANGFLIAPPQHPFIQHACNEIVSNARFFHHCTGNHNAMYATGPFFINRILNNPINVVTIPYLNELKIYTEN